MMRTKKTTRLSLALTGALALGGLLATGPGIAHSQEQSGGEVEAAIKYRQSVMSVLGGVMGTTVGQLRDGIAYGPELQPMAEALAAASGDIPALFPEGTGEGETDALPAVWEEREAFEEAAATFDEQARAFAEAVAGGERAEIFQSFRDLGEACKSCHEDFRD
ncbi:c-type cytochrome [Arhodomonas sp. SL1]|uniref:c-type cytochrome n=1 Tax=Arhodomonas sp. SL1 TaxID=3425691 RepID=UPI003F8827C9